MMKENANSDSCIELEITHSKLEHFNTCTGEYAVMCIEKSSHNKIV